MVAPPVALIAERRVILRLMRAGAVSGETARPLDNLRWMQARRLKRLVDAGVVQEARPGRYYLNVPALADHMTARRQRAALLLVVVLALIASRATSASRGFAPEIMAGSGRHREELLPARSANLLNTAALLATDNRGRGDRQISTERITVCRENAGH